LLKESLCFHVWNAGNECYELGEFQNAIIYYSRAIAVDPSDARLYSNRSACFTVLQMYGRALNDAQVRETVVFRGFLLAAFATFSTDGNSAKASMEEGILSCWCCVVSSQSIRGSAGHGASLLWCSSVCIRG
jgi:TPR repeat